MIQRIRRRYLVLKIMGEHPIKKSDLLNSVWNKIHQLFGEYGASQVNLSLIEYNPEDNHAIIRCSHVALEMVRASIATITKINEKTVAIHVVGVSGTLKSLRKKFKLRT